MKKDTTNKKRRKKHKEEIKQKQETRNKKQETRNKTNKKDEERITNMEKGDTHRNNKWEITTKTEDGIKDKKEHRNNKG